MGKVRVAVVGTGEFGRNHARVYREIQDAELVGVFDKNLERAQSAASEFGTHAFVALDDLRGRVDAVSLAVPTAEHAEVGCRLMEMGLDVLVEKPMAKTLSEADALLDAAKRHHRLLQVGHVERFNPAVLAVEPILNHPLFFEVHRLGVFTPRSLDVDVIYDLMIHDLDILLALVKQPVTEVRTMDSLIDASVGQRRLSMILLGIFAAVATFLAGLGFFVMGSSYWGRCYALGVAFFLTGALMPLKPEWGPLVFGTLWLVVLVAVGVRLRYLGKEANRHAARDLSSLS